MLIYVLKSYCYVPINCILIMMSFNEMETSDWESIYTFTAVLVTALEKWFLIKMKDSFQLRNISDLAYQGFLKNRFYFREQHLKDAELNLETTKTFLVNNIQFKLIQGKMVSYFCHLTWQELFMAVMLRLYIDIDAFKKFILKLETESRYEVVTKFLFGLCNEARLEDLIELVNDTNALNFEKDRTESAEMLKAMALERLKNLEEKNYLILLLPILGWVYEMQDEKFTREASNCLRNKIEITGQILPTDILCFNYVLQSRETELILMVNFPGFIGSSFRFFIDCLFNTINQNKKIQVSKSLQVKTIDPCFNL